MTQQIDIEKIKAALNAIEELEQIARSTQPADIKNFCVEYNKTWKKKVGNDSNLLIVFYVQIVPDDFVMQLHRF